MLQEQKFQNPNDYKVVSFHNSTEFGFLPEEGCMYDGRPINGKNGSPGIDAGETVVVPYHIGHQLAINLAKKMLNKEAPADAAGIPTGVAIWDTAKLEGMKNSYLKDLYVEEKPMAMTDTDKMMAKFEEYQKEMLAKIEKIENNSTSPSEVKSAGDYQDKKQVIEALEVRGIAHDKRKSKEELEKLLA